MENREALLILNAIESLEPRVLVQLLHRFGGAAEVLAQPKEILRGLVGATLAEKIRGWEKHFDLAGELRECKKRSVDWIDWNDTRYPESLRQIPQPPPVLYFRGKFHEQDVVSLGIVGSRQSSRYGVEVARSLARELADAGFTVVSGLARGIDTAAHEGALEGAGGRGRTVAVMGSGFSNPYPQENISLLNRIAERGLILSEFPLYRPPLGRNFPRRNRIISGMALGIVVVEAARRSGSLITASHALEQGRAVFAVPGRLDSESSQGANALIQQGAKLIFSAADIVEDLQYLLPPKIVKAVREKKTVHVSARENPVLTKAQQDILNALEVEPVDIEEVIKLTKSPAPEVVAGLLMLEMQGLVRQFPGKRFAKATLQRA